MKAGTNELLRSEAAVEAVNNRDKIKGAACFLTASSAAQASVS